MVAETLHILILHTTKYREGGKQFTQAALTLAGTKKQEYPGHTITCKAVESKTAFLDEIKKIEKSDGTISELHFIGHSGMYGIMFGSTDWPEQFSPHEWRQMKIPFATGARAYFHACRTGRWFAPFFARTFGVPAYGYFWYTTLSRSPQRYSMDYASNPNDPLYVISVLGKKSHGWTGLLKKHILRQASFPLLEFLPAKESIDTTYDSVAHLYDQTFEDISVRQDELTWLRKQIQKTSSPVVLDIGCGTGSFTRAIRDLVLEAHGVDLSSGMITHAAKRSEGDPKIKYQQINGPKLPYPDNTFDIVTSVLSFRYLDWDPIVEEVLRVLKPGGRLMVIDMVAAPVKVREWPQFLRDKLRQRITQTQRANYNKALRKMVNDPSWKKMLEYNPMRAEHEYKWYLTSRFPGGEMDVINYAFHSRILAFCSPPIYHKTVAPLTYP